LRHLILGSSAAAVSAAEVLLLRCPDDEVIMASTDESIHSRCMLHHYLSDERDVKSLDFTRRNFLLHDRLKWLPNEEALSVDVDKRIVKFKDNNITYDKLLIATGTVNFIPDITGLKTATNVYTLNNLPDALIMRDVIEHAKTIAVLGAGLIGMDIIEGIIKSGVSASVHIIESAKHIIPKQLDANIASKFQQRFEAMGAKFHLGKKVIAVKLDNNKMATAIEFEDKSILPCDMIIVAAGTRPNIDFLRNSGLELENGVKVDECLRTTNANVYAAGDVTGIAANWYAAIKQGRIAGNNMADNGKLEYTDRFHTVNTINLFKMVAASVGKVNPPFDGFEVVDRINAEKYLKIVMKDGLVVGVLLFGDISHSGHWKYIIENAVPICSLDKSPFLIEYADFFEIDESTAEFKYIKRKRNGNKSFLSKMTN